MKEWCELVKDKDMDITSSKNSMHTRFHESWSGSCFGHCCYGNF